MMGTGSYLKFNYNVRPSKSIERKMILEVLKDLYSYSEIRKFQYIGFGSVFYTDFRLFHKELNIKDMTCIERDEDSQLRFEFNKPYKCIDLIIGDSSEVLPKLNWQKPTICWLDYEDPLSPYMFDDIKTVLTKAQKGTFIMMTCNANPSSYRKSDLMTDDELISIEEKFKGLFTIAADKKSFQKNSLIPFIQENLQAYFQSVLKEKYGTLNLSEQLQFLQIFSVKYQDNSIMYTFGGIILPIDEIESAKEKLNKFDFISSKNSIYEISIPKLTNREIDTLNGKLPNDDFEDYMNDESILFIPDSFKKDYYSIYKHFPNYMEIRDF